MVTISKSSIVNPDAWRYWDGTGAVCTASQLNFLRKAAVGLSDIDHEAFIEPSKPLHAVDQPQSEMTKAPDN